MKRLLLSASIAIAASAFFSCGNKSAEDARREADSIKISTIEGQRDSLMTLIGEIGQTLAEVNRLEGIVASNDFQNSPTDKKQEILANIEKLKNELTTRKKKLTLLSEKIRQTGHFNEELKETIETQNELIDVQSAKIAEMQQQLGDANARIGELSANADSLNAQVDNITDAKTAAEQRSEAIGNELNTCYYAVGSNKELKQHNILEKKFLSRTKVLESDFDRKYFTKADKRTLREIRTNSSKAKILTKQPINSYDIVDNGDEKIIRITNPTLFWEKSNFLVIETK